MLRRNNGLSACTGEHAAELSVVQIQPGDIPEHMEDGKMGIFFEKQTAGDIVQAVKKFQNMSFNQAYIREKSLKFDKKLFKDRIKDYIEREYKEFKKDN